MVLSLKTLWGKYFVVKQFPELVLNYQRMIITLVVCEWNVFFTPFSILNAITCFWLPDCPLVGVHLPDVPKGPQSYVNVKVFSFPFSHLLTKHPSMGISSTAAKLPTDFYSIHLLALSAYIQINKKEYKVTNEHCAFSQLDLKKCFSLLIFIHISILI